MAEQATGFEFPRDRFVLYLKQHDCYGSQTLLAFMHDHPLPMQVVFLDFKSKLKSVPALEDRTTGKILSLDKTKKKIHALAESTMDPQLMQKAFVLYVHPRSATSNELVQFITEKNLAVDVFDIGFLDYVKGTPCLADMEEEAIYEAEGAIEGYQDMYDEFLDVQNQQASAEEAYGQDNGKGGKFHATNQKMLSFMGKTGEDDVQTKEFQTTYNTDGSLKPAPQPANLATFVSSNPAFSGLMRSSQSGDTNVHTKKFKTSFTTKTKTAEELTKEQEMMRLAANKTFVSSNPRLAFVGGGHRGASDHDMHKFHSEIQTGAQTGNSQQAFNLGHSMAALPVTTTTTTTTESTNSTASDSVQTVSNKDVSALLAKRRALRMNAFVQPTTHPSMQPQTQPQQRKKKKKTVSQRDINTLLAKRRAILAR